MGLLLPRFIKDLQGTRKGRIALGVLMALAIVLAVLVTISFARM